MIDPSNFRFPDVNKGFIRGVFWLLVFVFLASIFSSASGIYDRFIQKPELRKEILLQDRNIFLKDEIIIQRVIVVHNRGNADAENIRILCSIPNGSILRVEILSEDVYSFTESTHETACDYSLPRLSKGAKFVAMVLASVANTDAQITEVRTLPILSATHSGGTAIESQKPTAFEEMQGVSSTLLGGTSEILNQIDGRLRVSDAMQSLLSSHLPRIGVNYYGFMPTTKESFRKALITAILLSIAAWLLLRKVWAGLAIAGIFSLFVWLYLDMQVDILWMLIPAAVAVTAFFVTFREGTVTQKMPNGTLIRYRRRTRGRVAELSILFLFILLMVFGIGRAVPMTDWQCLRNHVKDIHHAFACISSTVHVGTWIGCMILASYLLVVDLD